MVTIEAIGIGRKRILIFAINQYMASVAAMDHALEKGLHNPIVTHVNVQLEVAPEPPLDFAKYDEGSYAK